MLQAMFNGVSGLQSNQTALDVIGNDIANVNTTGYKAGRVTFADQLSQSLAAASGPTATSGGTNPKQLGLGVTVSSIQELMDQGTLESTSNPTDLAVSGNGFFMVGSPNSVAYTRDGSFSLDSSGNLVSASGQSVLGWQNNATTGTIDTTQPITGSSKLVIPLGALTTVGATKTANFTGNLNAQSLSTDTPYTRNVTVYDSLGSSQIATISFQKSAALPAGAPSNATAAWNWSSTGTNFPAPTGTLNQGSIFYDASGNEISSTGSISLTPTNGANTPQTVTPDFAATTQFSSATTTSPASQDGFGAGTLNSFNIDKSGLITGVFSNGQSKPLGQIALANFANAAGLVRGGNNTFSDTINSGLPDVGTAASAGLGTITSSALEQSNVDLSSQFTDMIVTQRAFQANTKIVSTVDTLLNDLITMKQ